jgi:hypothetical protein
VSFCLTAKRSFLTAWFINQSKQTVGSITAIASSNTTHRS